MYNTYTGYQSPYIPNYQQAPQLFSNRQTQQPIPFQDVRFVTEQEANAYIVMANQRVLLIDLQQNKAWVKSADSWGQSIIEPYTFSKLNGLSGDAKMGEEEPKVEYLKKEDLPNLATKDDIKNVNNEILAIKKQIENKSLLVVKPEKATTGEV